MFGAALAMPEQGVFVQRFVVGQLKADDFTGVVLPNDQIDFVVVKPSAHWFPFNLLDTAQLAQHSLNLPLG